MIVVSGSIGEKKGAALMRTGAQDFVLKDNLSILGIAVKRSIEGVMERRARYAAEEALRESEVKYRAKPGRDGRRFFVESGRFYESHK